MKRKLLLLTMSVSIMTLFTSTSVLASFAIVVGKKASTDGSVLIGHNEQNNEIRFSNFRKISSMNFRKNEFVKLQNGRMVAMPPATNGFLWSESQGSTFSDSYINNKGVAIITNFSPDRIKKTTNLKANEQLKDKGVAYLFNRMIALRANTAREGVIIAGNIITHWGYAGSGTIIIADQNEAWILCATHGKQWAAERIPDNKVAIIPNVYTLGKIDFNDKLNFMGSKTLVSYAIKKGWYNPKLSKTFNFSEVYSAPRKKLTDQRQQTAQELITGKKIDGSKNERLPFLVTAKQKLNIADIIKILRTFKNINIYRGIDLTDLSNSTVREKIKHISEECGNLCSPNTQEAAVFQLNSKYPPSIGCIYWRATAEPSSSVLIPWYVGIINTPKDYHSDDNNFKKILTIDHHFSPISNNLKPDYTESWWKFKKLQDTVNKDKKSRTLYAENFWNNFENKIYSQQTNIQEQAAELYSINKPNANKYLTKYCAKTAEEALNDATQLTEVLQKMKIES
jgi:dipeptidase